MNASVTAMSIQDLDSALKAREPGWTQRATWECRYLTKVWHVAQERPTDWPEDVMLKHPMADAFLTDYLQGGKEFAVEQHARNFPRA